MGFFYCQERGREEDSGGRMDWKGLRSAWSSGTGYTSCGMLNKTLVAAHSGRLPSLCSGIILFLTTLHSLGEDAFYFFNSWKCADIVKSSAAHSILFPCTQ